MVGIEPFHQVAARVQADAQRRILFEQIEKRLVAVPIRLLENAVEVADRLVIVQDEGKVNGWRHRRHLQGAAAKAAR